MKETEPNPLFYEVVNNKLGEFARDLILEMHEAQRAAEGCGCPSCVKRFNRLVEEVEYEAWRLGRQPALDEEEEWIMNHYINKNLRDYYDQ